MAHSRREFLVGSGCGFLSGAAFLTGFQKLSLMNLFAQEAAEKTGGTGYKALVCLFFFGGNDTNNMLIPYDNYADYATPRAGGDFVIQQSELLPITPPSAGARFGVPFVNGTIYDFRPIEQLFVQQKLAFVVNMGTLLQPLTRAEYQSGAPRPQQLFSHSNQQEQNQTAQSVVSTGTGWGGRLADRFTEIGQQFPMDISLSGVQIFGAATRQSPLVMPPAPQALSAALPFDIPVARQGSLTTAVNALLDGDQAADSPIFKRASGAMTADALRIRAQLDAPTEVTTAFPNTNLGNQLKQIARMIKFVNERPALQMRRQVFFASLGGFDTHGGERNGQGALLTQVANAMKAFYDETGVQGIANQVTTFTLSDFNRTMDPGAGLTGTDHAWGSHNMVMGGAVRGGDFYGRYPSLSLGGDDDADGGTRPRGRWIPQISVDQYGATLSQWFGVPDADIPLVFPNVGSFSPRFLNFMT